MLLCDHYITARSLDEAFDAMDVHRGRYRLVAGATDLLPWAREGRGGDVHIPALIDIAKIPELNVREHSGTRVRFGAATQLQRFVDDHALMRAMPEMVRCALWFADDQIRELATIGGNLINASPAADANPCLYAHDTKLELAARRDGKISRRTIPIEEFILGPGKTAIEADEILVSIDCEALPGYGGSFEKVGQRRSLVISVVCLATLLKLDPQGRTIEDARLTLAGVCPVPQRLFEVEERLRGAPLSMDTIEAIGDMPLDLVRSRSRQEYRRDVVRGFLMRGLINAAKAAGAHPSVLAPEREAAYV